MLAQFRNSIVSGLAQLRAAYVAENTVPTVPSVTAKHVHVFDFTTQEVYYHKDTIPAELRPASLTKIVSVLVLFDHKPTEADLAQTTTITSGDNSVGGSGANLNVGDVISLRSLLLDMLLPSSNNATMAVARVIGQEILDVEAGGVGDPVARFVAEVNTKAAALGMTSSYFENAHGFTQNSTSTTEDIIKAAYALYQSGPLARTFISLLTYSMPLVRSGSATTVSLTNTNPVLGQTGVLGGKTGSISGPAAYNLVTFWKAPSGNLIAICNIGSSSDATRKSDAEAILAALPVDFPALAVVAPPVVTTTTAGSVAAGGLYVLRLENSGGPSTWTLDSGSLPSGFSLSSSGLLKGASSASGTYNFVAKATNSAGSDIETLTLVVAPAAQLSGLASVSAVATASLRAVTGFVGPASSSVIAAGALRVGSLLSGQASSAGTASAQLSTEIAVRGQASGSAVAVASLSVGARFSGSAVASAISAGAVKTSIQIAGIAIATGLANADIAATPLLYGGAECGGSVGSADLTTEVRLAGSAVASAAAQSLLEDGADPKTYADAVIGVTASGTLQTRIGLVGSAVVSGVVSPVDLGSSYIGDPGIFDSSYTADGKAIFDTAYYEPSIWLEGSATATGTAEGDLVVTIRLVGDAHASGSAAGALAAYVNDGQTLVGSAKGSAKAAATLIGDLRIAADATVVGISSAGLTTSVRLASAAIVSLSASGTTLAIDLSYGAKALASVLAGGMLSTQVQISAAAIAKATSIAYLSTPGRIEIPAIHRMAPMALRMIAKEGKALSLRVILQDDYNPATGTSPQTQMDYDTVGVRLDYEQKYIDGTTIKAGDQKLLMPPQNVPRPQSGHQVLMGGKAYRVVSVGAVEPNGKPALYELQLRGVTQ